MESGVHDHHHNVHRDSYKKKNDIVMTSHLFLIIFNHIRIKKILAYIHACTLNTMNTCTEDYPYEHIQRD